MRPSIPILTLAGAGLAALASAQPTRAQQQPAVAPPLLIAAQVGYADQVRIALRDEAGVVRAYMTYKQNLGGGPTVIVFTDARGNRLNAIAPPKIPPGPPAATGPSRPAGNPLAGPPLPRVDLPPGPRITAACERCDVNSDVALLQRQITALQAKLQGVTDRINAARVK